MQSKTLIAFLSLVAVSMFGSCTTRYQDLLRDRDAEIRALNGRIYQLQQEKEEVEAREAAARRDLEEARTKAPAEAVAQTNDLERLRRELDGASVDLRDGRLRIGVEDSVTFDSGSAALKDSSHRILQKIATVLKREFSGNRVYIEGHTDTDPIDKSKDKFRSNRHLSMERADAVARYLIGQGVPESQIVVVGYGQFDPKDARTKARNRRVEIIPGKPVR